MIHRALLTLSLVAFQNLPVSADIGDNSEFTEKCLMPGAIELENSTLNWKNIRFLEELDFCLLSVAELFSDAEKLIDWMAASGFHVSKPISQSKTVMRIGHNYDGEGVIVGGVILKNELEWSMHPLKSLFAYSLYSSFVLRDDGFPIRVNSVLNRK